MNIQVYVILFFLLMFLSLLSSFTYDPPGQPTRPCPTPQEIESFKNSLAQMRKLENTCSKPDLVQESFLQSLKQNLQTCQNTLKDYNQEIQELSSRKVSDFTYDDCIKKLKLCEKQIMMIIREEGE